MEDFAVSYPYCAFFLVPGHEDCLELLLEHSPFSYLEGNPFTPLHCAVYVHQPSRGGGGPGLRQGVF